MKIPEVLKYLYPESESLKDWTVSSAHGVSRIAAWNLPDTQPSMETLEETSQSPEFLEWRVAKLRPVIDKATSASIGASVHTLEPIGEQIGILRDQITRILNGEKKASDKFARLQKIATTEIEAARIEKNLF